MLRAAVADCLTAGVEVFTTLDLRAPAQCEATGVTPIGSGTCLAAVFDQLAREADATLVIAPETGGVLTQWAQRLASLDARSLGCDVASIRLCGDKRRLAAHLQGEGIATPPLIEPRMPEIVDFPVVVKPVDGAGCEQTFVCRSWREWRAVRSTEDPDVIVQRCFHWPCGISVGVCLQVKSHDVVPLICRRQRIGAYGDGPLQLVYEGGETLENPPLVDRAVSLARRAVAAVPGLRGIVGVDVVLGPEASSDVVIEINPRMTLSYAAADPTLRQRWIAGCLGQSLEAPDRA